MAAAAWDRELSDEGLIFCGKSGVAVAPHVPAATVCRPRKGDKGNWQTNPAACVAVPRDESGKDFTLVVLVEELPKAGSGYWLSFGVGRAMPKRGDTFGDDAFGT